MNRQEALIDRRGFCRAMGIGAAGLPLLASSYGWAAEGSGSGDTLVVIFQRGAMDGLNAVVPHAESAYYARRPTIAVAVPGSGEDAAIDLDGRFGLHPALAPLKPLYDQGDLALVHAVGLTVPSRSHFDAQDFMERAWLSQGGVFDGWLNRALGEMSGDGTFKAVGMGTAVSRSLNGVQPVVGMSAIEAFGIESTLQRAELLKSQLYDSFDGPSFVDSTGQRAFAAVDELRSSTAPTLAVDNEASYPDGAFGQRLRDLAALIKSGLGVQVATVDIGGWDHHNNEVQELPPLLSELATGLAAFHTDLGPAMSRVTVVVMTEFGRRVSENASRGTDHGRGGVMFALGGGVQGGQVYGDWPGLSDAALEDGDLRVTLDYRAVLAEMLSRRNGLDDLSAVFPGFDGLPTQGLFVPR
ncbi:MAG: DUF1501 domain-containing protein [Xanthomonadales bacterium]|nr:DUF1501 domain-containing protein [Xanthomonadales bacterium]